MQTGHEGIRTVESDHLEFILAVNSAIHLFISLEFRCSHADESMQLSLPALVLAPAFLALIIMGIVAPFQHALCAGNIRVISYETMQKPGLDVTEVCLEQMR